MLQTLLTLSSQPEGALELLKIEDLSPLTEIAVQYPEVLDILNFTWVNASIISSEADAVQKSINKTIPILLTVFSGTDAVTLLNLVGSLLPRLTPEVSMVYFAALSTSLISSRLFPRTQNGLHLL